MQKIVLPKKELEELYFERNFSIRDLCRHYNHDIKTILKIFREYNIPPRGLFDAWKIRKLIKTPPRISKEDLYREYILERKSTEKISLQYQIPVRSIRRYLKRYSIFSRRRFPTSDTSIERILEDELSNREIGHYKQYYIRPICKVDKAFPFEKIAVFCDGTYWHSFEAAKKRDARVNQQLSSSGWIVLRFTDDEINNHIEKIVDLIEEFLKRRRHLHGRKT